MVSLFHLEEIDEHVRIPLVNNAVSFLEQPVELEFWLDKQFAEEFCKKYLKTN